MIRTVSSLVFLTFTSGFAQPGAFEVASIREGKPGKQAIEVVPGSVTMRSTRLAACIRWAYGVQDYQISGPGWINEVTFDILAKAGTPAPEAELRQMMQALLADRFKLAFHRQVKEVSALILTVGKNGHKLKPVNTEDPPSFKTGKMNLTGKGATIAQLTEFLSQQLRNPVIDQTGLTGRFDYFLDINAYITDEMKKSGGPEGGPPPEAPTIIAQAMQSQLGLKVDSKKAPVEMFEIDHVERAPTEN